MFLDLFKQLHDFHGEGVLVDGDGVRGHDLLNVGFKHRCIARDLTAEIAIREDSQEHVVCIDDSNGASAVGITRVAGHLTDYYDPRDNNLHLSDENHSEGSVASVAVACHEAGHACQNASGYLMMRLRSSLVPIVNFTSQTWMFLFMAGILLNLVGLAQIAVALFAVSVLFHIVTLPVEIDASRRAVKYIDTLSMSPEDRRGSRAVLRAAALTYVASALISVLQLLYYMGRVNRRR